MALYRLELRCLSRRPTRHDTSGYRRQLARAGETIRNHRSIVAAVAYRTGRALVGECRVLEERTDERGRKASVRTSRLKRFAYTGRRRRTVYADAVIAPRCQRVVGASGEPAEAPMPRWAGNRRELWNAVERVERRDDALLAREFVLTLPSEVPLDAAGQAAMAWARDELAERHGMVADVAIHRYGAPLNPENADNRARLEALEAAGWPVIDEAELDGDDDPRLLRPHIRRAGEERAYVFQPHAHVLVTTRPVVDGGFDKKDRSWGGKAQLYAWRQSWEHRVNGLLRDHAVAERVDSRAAWRRQEKSARGDRLGAALEAFTAPTAPTTHLGDAARGRPKGRPRAVPKQPHPPTPSRAAPPRPTSKGRTVAQQPAASGNQPDPVTQATGSSKAFEVLHQLVDFALALRDEGISFHRTPSGALGWTDAPDRKLTPEERKCFSGMHGPVLLALQRHGALDAAPGAEQNETRAPIVEIGDGPGEPLELDARPRHDAPRVHGLDIDLSPGPEPLELDARSNDTEPPRQRPAPDTPAAEPAAPPAARPETSETTREPAPRAAPPRGPSKLRQQLEPLFKAARAGKRTATPDDPEVAWISAEFEKETRGRRDAERAQRELAGDVGAILGRAGALRESDVDRKSFDKLQRFRGQIGEIWKRVVSGAAQANESGPSTRLVDQPVLQVDPRNAKARQQLLDELRTLTAEEKMRKATIAMRELARRHPEAEKITAALTILAASLTEKDRGELPNELVEKLRKIADPKSRDAGRTIPPGPTRGPDRGFR